MTRVDANHEISKVPGCAGPYNATLWVCLSRFGPHA